MTEPAAEWCTRLGAALTEVGDGIGRLAGEVARDWSDAEGALRADRLTLLQRSVLRSAEDAADLGSRLERLASGMGPMGDLAALLGRLASLGAATRDPARGGITLGDVDAVRAPERPGMQLPDTSGS
ncbi:hypothetical protein ACQEVB_11495 [Pseudonocardia sp. CA-107938]|uniref:hypothetical protein n=1 Tax=Pseudonocardia sp. CA-107938 TaxID=3240021 RepID=UPI003D8E83E2